MVRADVVKALNEGQWFAAGYEYFKQETGINITIQEFNHMILVNIAGQNIPIMMIMIETLVRAFEINKIMNINKQIILYY